MILICKTLSINDDLNRYFTEFDRLNQLLPFISVAVTFDMENLKDFEWQNNCFSENVLLSTIRK